MMSKLYKKINVESKKMKFNWENLTYNQLYTVIIYILKEGGVDNHIIMKLIKCDGKWRKKYDQFFLWRKKNLWKARFIMNYIMKKIKVNKKNMY